MANIQGQKIWSEVRLLETHELARGGANGNLNEQAKALTDRTEFLNQEKASKSEIIQGVFEFSTYAEFNAAKATLPSNCTVVIGEKNTTGTGQWGLGNNRWNGSVLSKSSFDPVEEANKKITPVKKKLNSYDLSLKKGYFAIPILSISGTKLVGTAQVVSNEDNIDFKSGQTLIVSVTSNFTSGTWFTLRGYKSDGSYVDIIPRAIIQAKLDTTVTLADDFVSFRIISEETTATTYTVTCDLYESAPILQADVISSLSQTTKNKAEIEAIVASEKSGAIGNKFINFSSTKDTAVSNININRNNVIFANGDSIYVQFAFNNLNSWFTLRGYKIDGTYDTLIARTALKSVEQIVTLSNNYVSFRVTYEYNTGITVAINGGIYASKPVKSADVVKNATDIATLKLSDSAFKDSLRSGYLSNQIIDFSGVKTTDLSALTVNKTNALFKSGDVLKVKAVYENYEIWFNLRGYKEDGSYDNIIARTALKSVDQTVTLANDYVSFRMIFDYNTGVVINVKASMSVGDPLSVAEFRALQAQTTTLYTSMLPFSGKKLFCVGDSITMNATDWNAMQGGYIYSILQNTGMTLQGSTGSSGNGMPLMLFARNMKTFTSTILQADVLTVLGGTNDYHSLSAYTIGSFADEAVPYSQLETVSPMSIYQAVKTIIKCAQAIKPSIKIIFFTEPERGIYTNSGTNYPSTHTPPNASPNGLTMHGIASAIKDCANKLGVAAFDTHAELWIFEQASLACPDNLHPSKAVSTKMGELFAKKINSLVQII